MLNVKGRYITTRHSEKTGKDYAVFEVYGMGDTIYVNPEYIKIELHENANYRIIVQAFTVPDKPESGFLAYRVASEV